MAAQIQEFRFDKSPWRLDYLGGLHDAEHYRQEPLIDVYLSELDMGSGDPLLNPSLAEPPRHKVAQVKIGQLPLLKHGSVWIDGIEVQPAKCPREESFSLSPSAFQLMRFDSQVSINGQLHKLMGPSSFRIGRDAAAALADSWIAVAYNPNPDFELLAIPSTVIFQKCMATSPKAVRHLVHGLLDKIVDPTSGFLDDERGTFYVELFKDFKDREAKAMANLKASEAGRLEYTRMRNELVRARANQGMGSTRQRSLPHLKLSFPFDRQIDFFALGKRLAFYADKESPPKWGFLVTQILQLSTRLPFDHLVIGRKNDSNPGNNADDADLPDGWSNSPEGSSRVPDGDQPIDSSNDPSKDGDKWALEAAGDFTAEGLITTDKPKEVQKYRNRSRTNSEGVKCSGTGTTGNSGSNPEGVADVDIHAEETPKVPITLDDFFGAIDILNAQGHPIETIVASQYCRRRENGPGIVNFLPRKIKGNRSWHLTSDLPGASPRAYVIARWNRGGCWHYFIELERKGKDAFAIQHVRAHSGEAIPAERLAGFMINVAVLNGWQAKEHYTRWIFEKINHPTKDRVVALARAILKST